MADRVSSDHPSVRTVRATLAKTATGLEISVPAEGADAVPTDEVVRLVVDGTERYVRIERPLTGEGRTISGIYDAPSVARDPAGGTDRLPEWVDDRDVSAGGSILLDVIEPDFLYGLRAPGETAIYEAREPPEESLRSIAEDIEEG